jgi:hypothetical protein
MTRTPAPTGDYCTIHAIPSPTTPTYANKPLGSVTVQFSCWTNAGGARAATLANAIVTAFDNNLLTLSRGKVTNVQQMNTPVPRVQMQRDRNGAGVTMCSVDFKYSLEIR